MGVIVSRISSKPGFPLVAQAEIRVQQRLNSVHHAAVNRDFSCRVRFESNPCGGCALADTLLSAACIVRPFRSQSRKARQIRS